MSTRRQTILIVLLIVASTLLVYGHTIRNQFLNWDDYDNITENYLFNPVTPANIKRLWTEPFLGLYVPATYTLMGLESHFATRHDPDFGASITPALFRAVSVGMHLLCALMVFAILRRFTNHPWAAGAGALLFALHPLQAESVCWITEQRGLLAAAFGIGALVLLQGPRENKMGLRYTAASLLYALALLSKPSAVSIPLMALVLAWIGGANLKRSTLLLLPWLVLAMVFVAVSKFEQSDDKILTVTPLLQRPFIAGDALTFYLYKLLLPFRLAPDYGRSPPAVLSHAWAYATWIPTAVLILLGAWQARRGKPSLLATIALLVVGLAPVLGLIPFSYQDKSTVADRYMYLAMIGPALAMTLFLSRTSDSPGPAQANGTSTSKRIPYPAVSALILVALALLTFLQSRHWLNNDLFYAHALRVNPTSKMAHNNLSGHLMETYRNDEATRLLRAATALYPENKVLINNLVSALLTQQKYAEAVPLAHKALTLDRENSYAHVNLGIIYINQGRLDDALAAQRAAVRLDPGSARAYANLGHTLMEKGRHESGFRAIQSAVRLNPHMAVARRNLGVCLMQRGERESGTHQLEIAVQLNPDEALSHRLLARAYAETGRPDLAVETIRNAIARHPDLAQELAPDLEQHLGHGQ